MINNTLSLSHIERMTDRIGILEHCLFSTPDRTEGYSTDDNARALQSVLRLGILASKEYIKKYTSIYLQFLLSAHTPDGFHQDLNCDLTWKHDADTTEGFGRAMAALGEAGITALSSDQRLTALFLFDKQAHLIKKVKYNRSIAQVISALSYRIQFETNNPQLVSPLLMRKKLKGDMHIELPINIVEETTRLADILVQSYRNHSSKLWNWFEDELVYDNGRLPWGLFFAYKVTRDKTYLNIAVKSLDFLLSKTFDIENECFSFPGYRGWFPKKGKKALYGQQPIEAGSTVEVCVLAYEITHQKKYLDYAIKALEWYKGRNILKINLINPDTGGVKDGLEEWGINPNEGAESILSYMLAYLALKKVIS